MALFGRKKTTVGLDIGSGLIKVAVIDHGRGQPELVKVAITPLLADAIVEGEIMDPGIVSDAIRTALASAGVKNKEVVTAVGGRDVIIKKIQIDRVKETEVRDVVRWEAEQHVPFDMESVELDCQVLNPEDEGLDMSVLLVAAKRELIENRMSLLADAGIQPAIIDVDAFAIHNAFEHNYPEAVSGLVALVNIGHDTTNVNLLKDGAPILVRDVPFGSRRLREALQRERGFTSDHAENLLQGRGAADDIRSLLDERVDELAVGIERAAAFIVAQSGGEGIGRVFLSGGGAAIPGMVQALGNRLGVRTEVASPLKRVGVRPDVMQSTAIDEVAPMLMLPIGLALRTA